MCTRTRNICKYSSVVHCIPFCLPLLLLGLSSHYPCIFLRIQTQGYGKALVMCYFSLYCSLSTHFLVFFFPRCLLCFLPSFLFSLELSLVGRFFLVSYFSQFYRPLLLLFVFFFITSLSCIIFPLFSLFFSVVSL